MLFNTRGWETKVNEEASWRKAAKVFLAAFFGTLGLYVLLIVFIDPYDSGRFPTFMPPGTPVDRPATLNVSRGRDPRFNSVVLGDSRSVLIDPQQLTLRTSLKFVQMAIEGATVRDQMVFLHWFARHHPSIDAILFATDQQWCDRDPALPHSTDFPSALYAESDLDYLRATLNLKSAHMMQERLLYTFGIRPRIEPDRYVDIEAKYPWRLDVNAHPNWHKRRGQSISPAQEFPALRLLDEFISGLENQPRVILWMPPYFAAELPPPDSAEAQYLAVCKAIVRDWAARRPHTAFLDFQVHTAAAEVSENFLDGTHARRRLLASTEEEIAAAFVGLN